ncbi:AsmA family protein [Stappia sp. F7233]|uniref:AsmA family protein n=1 Tax=Stappia albiluteola TaxID=2758565 RepID=A0A839AKG7_9HYPH|nr:AsmA family protein [Stappia albiluteola]MBA5778949.1 AsmA family protein [Stappia albiluteola]
MKRLFVGFAGLIFLLAVVVLVVPFLLPKETIKEKVVAEIEKATGWHLRLDGSVSLGLVPGFRLIADDVGISGEAGADGIEFLKAAEIDFGLSWGALFGGNVQVTHVALDAPEIFLEIGPNGRTSFAPRRRFPVDRWNVAVDAGKDGEADDAPAEPKGASTSDGGLALLERIGVDELSIADGRVIYADREAGTRHQVDDVDLAVRLPSLSGPAELDGALTWQQVRVEVAGSVAAPLALSRGEESDVALTVKALEGEFAVAGRVSPAPSGNLKITASGPASASLLAALGLAGAKELGAYSLDASLVASRKDVVLEGLNASLGGITARGSGKVDLSGALPAFAGNIVSDGIALEEVLRLAGRDEPATGRLSTDLTLRGTGSDAATILGSLDIRGRISLADGTIGNLGLAKSLGGDTSADSLKDLNASVVFDGLDKPVAATGGLTWKGEPFALKGSATPAPYLAGLGAPVSVTLSGKRASFGFEGSLENGGGIDGDVLFSTPDLRGLAGWLGQPIAPGDGLKNFRIAGKLAAEGNTVSFRDATLELDDTRGKGESRLVLASPLQVTAKLALEELALDPYLGGNTGAGATAGGNKPQKARRAGDGWSTEPIDFSGLRAVDASLDLSAQKIRWDKLKTGRSRLTVTVKSGSLTAELTELSLYEGTGTGRIRLNGANAVPSVEADFKLSGLKARPFLDAAGGFDYIDGRLSTSFDLKASGKSQAEFVSALSGAAGFDFADGAILGINIPKMVRGLTVETLLGWADAKEQKTDFNALTASFRIENGIARSDDLAMSGPLLRMTGAGSVDMPSQTLDWRFEPKVVPTLEGQAPVPTEKGETRELAGIGVPVVVRGPWAKPQIYPDIKGILENPQAAYKQLETLGGGLVKALNAKPDEGLAQQANKVIEQATGGKVNIDVQKVIEGEANDTDVLQAVEEGFGLPKGLLGSFGLGGSKKKADTAPTDAQPAQ